MSAPLHHHTDCGVDQPPVWNPSDVKEHYCEREAVFQVKLSAAVLASGVTCCLVSYLTGTSGPTREPYCVCCPDCPDKAAALPVSLLLAVSVANCAGTSGQTSSFLQSINQSTAAPANANVAKWLLVPLSCDFLTSSIFDIVMQ